MRGGVSEAKSSGPSRGAGPRKWGRRIAFGAYLGTAIAIAIACAVQITQQTFFPDAPSEPLPFATCEAGIHGLYDAIERGRNAADQRTRKGLDLQPEAALYLYRQQVTPVWEHHPEVVRMCGSRHRRLLDALDRLRYSEEHVVRHQAAELTALRRRVRHLVASSLPPAAPAGSAPDAAP